MNTTGRRSKLDRIQVTIETLESYSDLRRQSTHALDWRCLFVMPFWLRTVWRHLGGPGEPHIVRVDEDSRPIGVAPLAVDGHTAHFLGTHEVCDYQDLITEPGRQITVMEAVMNHLRTQGVTRLDLRTLRPDSLTLKALKEVAPRQLEDSLEEDEVTYEMDLPGDWDGYLMQLNGKQRHEVRRKIRRLESNGSYTYRAITRTDQLNGAAAVFFDLFQRNRQDKAKFMDDAMAAYFSELMTSLAREQMLRLCFLEVQGQPAATVLCFDHDGTRYLYNSGYDADFEQLSVGVLSKVFSIQQGIGMGCRRFDFLKGAEVYKKRIGGSQLPLYRCKMDL